jgi:sugar/nucleoside kinase (ribokinase family)
VDPEGRRSVVSAVSAGAPAVLEAPPLSAARVVLLDGHHLDLALAVARAQRDRGAVLVLDGGSWKPGLERLLPLLDVAVVSADFSCPPEHQPQFDAIPHRAVTAGSWPIRVLSSATTAGELLVPVPTVEAVDTLGAGDVLHGALCHRLASSAVLDRGTFVRALEQAAAVASRSCTARGVLGWAHAPE